MELLHRYCVETKIDMLYESKHPGYKERIDQDSLQTLGYEIAKFLQQNPDIDIIVKIVESESRVEYVLGVCDIRSYCKEARFYNKLWI